ncbi:MAG TPA: ATP-binding protein [Kofleriaceae bacterium]|jgi:nitrogen fixation/metabolism regulation signal transduction histidine kinase
MSSVLWFVMGLGVGLVAIAIRSMLDVRRAREAVADIRALADGGEPSSPRGDHGELFRAARELADARTRDLQGAAAREALLRAALDGTPSAIVVFSEAGRISLANAAARELFFEDKDPQGEDFVALLGNAPDALRRALTGDGDELFSVDDASGERQTYILGKRRFVIDGESMVLVLVKNLSRELHRQEADAWKHMIRVFCHELNNSLAPVSSLVHSAKMVVEGSPLAPKLERVFTTIAERTDHLRRFLDSYAQFAKLPMPRKIDVAWRPFVDKLLALFPSARLVGDLPTEPGWFDAGQLEQVLINLLKNASECGGEVDVVTLAVAAHGERGFRITIGDRGPGMSAEVMERALVPFYSTKQQGSGLGLTLSREIVEAHGGAMRLENRDDGGLAVHVRLVNRSGATDVPDRRLTLTRS